MDTQHATPELFAALSKAQGEIENASKSSANPHFKSKYADLAEILNTVRPVFSKHGLSLIQSTGFDGSLVTVTTLLAHAAGGYVSAQAACVPAKTDAQGIGSATTYLRRYSAAAVAGIAQEDDDGQAAAHDGKPVAVSEAARIKAEDFKAAIEGAADDTELQRVGMELAGAGLPAGLLKNLRALYSARHRELAPKAAA